MTQKASKQATRKVQQGAGSVKELLNEDTGSTIGAAGVFGLAVVVAGALVLGSESLQIPRGGVCCQVQHAAHVQNALELQLFICSSLAFTKRHGACPMTPMCNGIVLCCMLRRA